MGALGGQLVYIAVGQYPTWFGRPVGYGVHSSVELLAEVLHAIASKRHRI